MPLPEDVSTFTLTFGPYEDLAQRPTFVGMTGTLRTSTQVRHRDTGQVISPVDTPVTIGEDGTAQVENLPHTGQDSLYPADFRYVMRWKVRRLQPSPRNKRFAVPVGSRAEEDFDALEDSPDVPGTAVPLAARTEDVLAASEAATTASSQALAAATQAAQAAAEAAQAAAAAAAALTAATQAASGSTAATEAAQVAQAAATQAQSQATAAQAAASQVSASLATRVATSDPRLSDQRVPLDGTVSDPKVASGRVLMLPAERTKLDSVSTGATANATDAQLRDRETHTGVQTTATIADLREFIEDTVGGMLRAVGADLDISYDDQTGVLSVDYTGVATDPEQIRDAIGAAMVGIGNVSVLVNDDGDTIAITTAATVNDTNAALRDRTTHTGTQPASTVTEIVSGAPDGRVWINSDERDMLRSGHQNNNGWALVRRDGDGRFGASGVYDLAAPVNPDDAVNKGYADAGDAALDTRLDTAEATLAAATNAATGSALVRRDAAGTAAYSQVFINSSTPSSAGHAARKDYVDAQIAASGDLSPVVVQTLTGPGAALVAANLPSTRLWTLGINVTLGTLPTPAATASGTITLVLIQPATGGPYTVTWPSGIKWSNGASAPAMPTTASARLVVHLFWTGTEWLGMVAGTFF